MTSGEYIVQIARKYLGIQELKNNSGWSDKVFQKRMEDVGWKVGESYCVYWAELVWKEAYALHPAMLKRLDELFSGSATRTHKNFSLAASEFKLHPTIPVPGALAIWRYGNGWMGHAGIVTEPEKVKFHTIEANTNASGGREGIEIAGKTRQVGLPYKAKGLNLLGFVYPPNLIGKP
jgi:hypothetical protein